MRFVYNDGGRSNYFKVGNVGDCCCRAICNTTGLDYKRIYDLINKISVLESTKHHRRGQTSSARDGVFKETAIKIIEALGGEKVKVQEFGSSVKCHLCDEDLNQYDGLFITYPIYGFNAPKPIIAYVKKLTKADKQLPCLIMKQSGEHLFWNNASSLYLISLLKKRNVIVGQ